jgi:hypothetical protein
VELKRLSHARYAERYILPELRKEYSAERSEGIYEQQHVDIQHIVEGRAHSLMVRAGCRSRSCSVACEVKSRLIRLTRSSVTHTLEGWTQHHADAIISSKV